MRTLLTIIAALLLAACSPALAQEAPTNEPWIPQASNPAGDRIELQTSLLPAQPDLASAVRTGVKKGVLDQVSDEELFAGPDAAVLKSGFYEPWSALLAELHEPSALVDAKAIVGLEKTKPFLIIPSGALRGAGVSAFFKAGLSAYARSGGVIIAFAQQEGEDFDALPAPDGSRLKGAGWTQDSGPLFRASSVQSSHPLLSGTTKTKPNIETSGYLSSLPEKSQVVLSRTDGYATLIVYPMGAGWVVVATLFSDYAYGQGRLSQDEKMLVRSLVQWAKAPSRIVQATPGVRLDSNIRIRIPEQGGASTAKISVIGPDTSRLPEQLVQLASPPGQTAVVPFSCIVPIDAAPGIYHAEYVLLDAAGKTLSPSVEADADRFAIGRPDAAPPVAQQKQPLMPLPITLLVEPLLTQTGDKTLLLASISSAASSTAPDIMKNQDYFLRVGNTEKPFRLTNGKAALEFELFSGDAAGRIPYALYHSSGRSLARGNVLASPLASGLALDRPYAVPGQAAKVRAPGMGKGELTLTGAGVLDTQMLDDNTVFEFMLPAQMPSGTFPLHWSMRKRDNSVIEGELPLVVAGYTIAIQNIVISKQAERDTTTLSALLRIKASASLPARVTLMLRSPDNRRIPAFERDVTLAAGTQDLPVSFSPGLDKAGIWELLSTITVRLPEGPGLTTVPVAVASQRAYFDTGNAALLGITLDKPVYDEPAGQVMVSVIAHGVGREKLELFLDTKRVRKEQLELAGSATTEIPLRDISPGTHTIKAVLTSGRIASVLERRFVYGARLPDLTVTIQAPKPAGTVLPVGIGVRNEGKSPADRSRVALYEGDPAQGGALITKLDVPRLLPGEQHVALVDWSLYKKTGRRTLFAVVDSDHMISESNTGNNSAMIEVQVPDLLLALSLGKDTIGSDETIAITVIAANPTATPRKGLAMQVQLVNQEGQPAYTETIPIPVIQAGGDYRVDRSFMPAALPIGQHQVVVRLLPTTPLVSRAAPIAILPTLAVSGTLDATLPMAALCRPFTLNIETANKGNVPVSTGSLKLEIKAAGTEQTVFARQTDFATGIKSIPVESVDFPQGKYTIRLKAAVANQQYKLSKDLLLAERALIVDGPISIQKSKAPFPRVLIWKGKSASPLDQAVSGSLLQQAFAQEGILTKVVDNADDFTSQAVSNLFNVYVLFETGEMLQRSDWLLAQVRTGKGIVLIGNADTARGIAEEFGFTFSGLRPDQGGAMLALADDLGLGLSGTLPVNGPALTPFIKSARSAASFTDTTQPAILIDRMERGVVVLLPFSVVSSARDTVTTALYSLLLRSAAQYAVPEAGSDSPASGVLTLSSAFGPLRARVIETLPAGSNVLWQNGEARIENNRLTFELSIGKDPQSLRYLYTPHGPATEQASTEVLFECNNRFVSQGKTE